MHSKRDTTKIEKALNRTEGSGSGRGSLGASRSFVTGVKGATLTTINRALQIQNSIFVFTLKFIVNSALIFLRCESQVLQLQAA